MGKYGFGRVGEIGSEATECAVVAIESVTGVAPLPAGIVADGEKDAVAPVGNPEAVNDTAFAVEAFAGTTIRLKFAG
jgi:formylmethanofuran:tetrahydromethanopterin formyltransferase